MKRVCFLFFLVGLVFCLALSASADETETMPEEYREFLGAMPDEILSLFPEEIASNDPAVVANALSKFGNFASFLEILKELFFKIIGPALKLCFGILGILLLSKILEETGVALSLSGNLSSAFAFLKSRAILFPE